VKHIMLDLETMSTASNAAIVAIGAVEFEPATGELGRTFYRNVSLMSCQNAGLDVEAGTVMWWLSRSEEARKALIEDALPLREALKQFNGFLYLVDQEAARSGKAVDIAIWGKGSDFDNVILANAHKALRYPLPWKYKNNRDVRTILALVPDACDGVESEGTKHNALDDAIYQARCVSRAWQELTR
jgi:exodeoxyribonuclease VIII